jgi:hypothetical protein
MKIIAFLQNAWFPEKSLPAVRAAYLRRSHTSESRARLTARYLFYRCPTGKRLKAAFGDLCGRIIWEEASPEVAGESSGVFPPDPEHIGGVLNHFKPDVVLVFGKVAEAGIAAAAELTGNRAAPVILVGPHPVARHEKCMAQLRHMADLLRGVVSGKAEAAGGSK